jgi:hypothetical protein
MNFLEKEKLLLLWDYGLSWQKDRWNVRRKMLRLTGQMRSFSIAETRPLVGLVGWLRGEWGLENKTFY